MGGDNLISILAADLKPVRRVPGPLRATLIWIAAASGIMAIAIGLSHIRPDLGSIVMQRSTVQEVSIAALTAVLSAFAVFQLAIPGRSLAWAVPPLLSGLGWVALLGVGCWHDLAVLGWHQLPRETSVDCLTFIAGFGTPILLMTLFLARHALLLRPVAVALLAALAASACADAGLVVVDHPHAAATTLLWHGGAGLLLAGLAALLGPWWMTRAVVLTGRYTSRH